MVFFQIFAFSVSHWNNIVKFIDRCVNGSRLNFQMKWILQLQREKYWNLISFEKLIDAYILFINCILVSIKNVCSRTQNVCPTDWICHTVVCGFCSASLNFLRMYSYFIWICFRFKKKKWRMECSAPKYQKDSLHWLHEYAFYALNQIFYMKIFQPTHIFHRIYSLVVARTHTVRLSMQMRIYLDDNDDEEKKWIVLHFAWNSACAQCYKKLL